MSASTLPRLALVGDRGNHDELSHPKIDTLLADLWVEPTWVPTVDLHDVSLLEGFHGIWVVPGAPYLSQKGVHLAIRYAREARLPFLGTCGGFFSALIEHAQNVLRLPEAVGVDENPEKLLPLVTPLSCSFAGAKTKLLIRKGSRLASIYGDMLRVEEFLQCDYGLAAHFMDDASRGDVRFNAWDVDGAPRALELDGHPFFLGVLFQPELSSVPEGVHPIIAEFLDAVQQIAAHAPNPTASTATAG